MYSPIQSIGHSLQALSFILRGQYPLLLILFNFNLSMDK